ncbi:hypothetical protein [Rhizobium leucaenae]|uniref:Uncharacterized protein n=1 Tax=Rhizobium leucaenae TaxID=29450 RepID=A0A7W7ELB8_9HYPH|nr:hypothetical protein [Rhizobium leucaenae]MBB4569339.1 hypothetical protein [Rhizobium leucaenae]MBB6302791.1 hypothetical protein [Rhizobium leucaenae]
MRQQVSATAYFGYGQFDEAAGLAAWSCFIVVVFFDVDIALQSLAFPASLLAPLLVPLVVLPLLVLEPLVLLVPVSPEPEDVDAPEPLPELDPLPLLPDCWANADVARPMERTDTAMIFKNMIFSFDVLCLPTSNKYRPGMFQSFQSPILEATYPSPVEA